MFGLLRKVGWIGGLVVLSRTPAGQQVIAKAKAYATNPKTRRTLTELRTKMTSRSNR